MLVRVCVACAAVEVLYNGMLRRYAGVRAIVPSLRAALKAILPVEYRWSRAVNKLLIAEWFERWRVLPSDWHTGGASTQLMRPKFLGGKTRRVLRAELFDTGGMSLKAMSHITREAQNQGPAWLATEAALKDKFGLTPDDLHSFKEVAPPTGPKDADDDGTFGIGGRCRLSLAHYWKKMGEKNALLEQKGHKDSKVILEELIAAQLYTG